MKYNEIKIKSKFVTITNALQSLLFPIRAWRLVPILRKSKHRDLPEFLLIARNMYRRTQSLNAIRTFRAQQRTLDSRFLRPLSNRRQYSNFPNQQTQSGARDKTAVGVFTPKAAAVFVLTGVALYFYFDHEKQKLQEQKSYVLVPASSLYFLF